MKKRRKSNFRTSAGSFHIEKNMVKRRFSNRDFQMKGNFMRSQIFFVLLILAATTLLADEGMYLYKVPPVK